MIRWLKNRKEKKEQRRQDKHRRILNALKSRDPADFVSDEFMRNCETETFPHDYEEINDFPSAFQIQPQFTKVVKSDFKIRVQPPQLPARVFSAKSRTMSASECRENISEEKFRERAVSLPSFERPGKFPAMSDADEEPVYNEPWDCKSNLTVECYSKIETENSSQDVNIQVRLFEKCINRNSAIDKDIEDNCSRVSVESQIYSEIEESDLDTLSQTGSESSVFIHGVTKKLTFQDDVYDSDASSGFYEELDEVDEEHKHMLMKSLGYPGNTIYTPSLFRRRSCRNNSYPRSPCFKIYEDSDMYLVPKRNNSLRVTTTEKLDLPMQKNKSNFNNTD